MLRDQKGFIVVYMAFLIVVLCALVGLAVDVGYMYLVKTQLQNAADAAALAGASALDGTNSTFQMPARTRAVALAAANTADGEPIVCDANNNNNAQGDVCIGFFDSNTPFTTAIPAGKIANAVKVTARRASVTDTTKGQAPAKAVQTFFARVLGWTEMSVASAAVAGRPPRPTIPIALCISVCNLPVPVTFYLKESDIGTNKALGAAWTKFSPNDRNIDLGPNGEVQNYLTHTLTPPDVCHQALYTNNGMGDALNTFHDVFLDAKAKSGLSYWEVVVPLVQAPPTADPCEPPGSMPIAPFTVEKYATIRITDVQRASGGANFTVSGIQCRDCDSSFSLGDTASLYQ
jgi:Flp pilus assembly protein TadG